MTGSSPLLHGMDQFMGGNGRRKPAAAKENIAPAGICPGTH